MEDRCKYCGEPLIIFSCENATCDDRNCPGFSEKQ